MLFLCTKISSHSIPVRSRHYTYYIYVYSKVKP
nr:MAG TPA: hypothetical protein [Caudoviricetes sp.]